MIEKITGLIFLIFSLLVMTVKPSPFIVGVLFGLVLIFRQKLQEREKRHHKKLAVFAAILIFSLIFEFGAAIEPYAVNQFGGAARFHPEVVPDMLIGLLYWVPFSLVWMLLLSRYKYSAKQIFAIGGIYGALTEQAGLVPLLIISGQAAAGLLTAGILIFLYGSALAAPFMVVEKTLPQKRSTGIWRFILPYLIIFPISVLSFLVFLAPLKAAMGVV